MKLNYKETFILVCSDRYQIIMHIAIQSECEVYLKYTTFRLLMRGLNI